MFFAKVKDYFSIRQFPQSYESPFEFKSWKFIQPWHQVLAIAGLIVLSIVHSYMNLQRTGGIYGPLCQTG